MAPEAGHYQEVNAVQNSVTGVGLPLAVTMSRECHGWFTAVVTAPMLLLLFCHLRVTVAGAVNMVSCNIVDGYVISFCLVVCFE